MCVFGAVKGEAEIHCEKWIGDSLRTVNFANGYIIPELIKGLPVIHYISLGRYIFDKVYPANLLGG